MGIEDDVYVIHDDTCDVCITRMSLGVQIDDYNYGPPHTLRLCLGCLNAMVAKIEEEL